MTIRSTCKMVRSERSVAGQWSLRNYYSGWRQFSSWTSKEFGSMMRVNSKWDLCGELSCTSMFHLGEWEDVFFPVLITKGLSIWKKYVMELKIWWKRNFFQKRKQTCVFNTFHLCALLFYNKKILSRGWIPDQGNSMKLNPLYEQYHRLKIVIINFCI